MVTEKEIDAVAVFDRYGAVAVELNFFCGVRRYVALGMRCPGRNTANERRAPHNLSKASQDQGTERFTNERHVLT